MKLKSVCALVVLVALNACAGLGKDRVPDEYVESPDKAAFLVGSIGVKTDGNDESPNSFNEVHFRKIGDDKIASIVIYQETFFPSDPSQFDYEQPDKKGKVFSLALKPGEYEIFNVSFYYNNGYVEKSYEAKEEFSVPFSLQAGKAFYIGNFLAFGRYGKNIFGITIAAGGYFVHHDEYERDLPLLLKKFPELEEKEMVRLDLKMNLYPLLFSDPGE